MGEVYRARDTKLNRDVALKILPEAFAADPDRLARFRREAQVLASLNHPSIGHIYGFEDSGATHAIVLELIDGPTLADRIAVGPIALPDALPIAKQIAEALEAAHEAGIVHRDLKPANIKIKDDGSVKVLDFGLAKALAPEAASGPASLANSPTITSPATELGLILGTAAYMSPEQAKGRAVDKRADIWAFGVVLYEMVTGRRLFDAEDVSETLAAVLTRDTTVTALPADLPARLRALVANCLVRDPRQRLRDIGDARIELGKIIAGAPDGIATTGALPAVKPTLGRAWLWPSIALVCFVAAAALAGALVLRPEPIVEPVRFAVALPGDATFLSFRLSPDGRKIAVVGLQAVKPRIWVHSFDTGTFEALAGTDKLTPAVVEWSPDSKSLVFSTEEKLRTIAAAGGPAQVIANLPVGRAYTGAWGSRDVILLGPMSDRGGPLLKVSAAGGDPQPATELDASKGESGHRSPSFLPDGRHFLFVAIDREGRKAYVGSLDSKERWPLPGIATVPSYSDTGHILFLREGSLMAQRFDVKRLALDGSPFLVVDKLAEPSAIVGAFHTSTNGTLAYRSSSSRKTTLIWFDRTGKQLQAAGPVGDYSDIELTLDDRYVTFESGSPGDIWVLDLQSGVTQRLTSDPARDADPVWSPDGKTIAFRGDRDGGHLYARAFGMVGQDTSLLKSQSRDSPSSWSRDGKYLAFDSQGGISALPLSGDPTPIRVTEDPTGRPNQGQISPDSHWIAYQADELGQSEVFVQSFPRPGAKRRVSSAGGRVPRWSNDGRELFYIAPGEVLMSVPITTAGESLNVGAPVRLFVVTIAAGSEGEYAVSTTGRFLLNVPVAEATATPITMILNWGAGVRGGRGGG
jgi:eukaryotic-like serine/threonine-protein kinase